MPERRLALGADLGLAPVPVPVPVPAPVADPDFVIGLAGGSGLTFWRSAQAGDWGVEEGIAPERG